jgi:integrase
LTGIRFEGCVSLTWPNVDFENRMITYVKKRKRGERNSWGKLPMTSEVEAILRRQVGYHRMQVWTYIAHGKKGGKGGTPPRRNLRRGRAVSDHVYQSTNALEARYRQDRPDRLFHDLRHTAASRVLRQIGNSAVVQEMLGPLRSRQLASMRMSSTKICAPQWKTPKSNAPIQTAHPARLAISQDGGLM